LQSITHQITRRTVERNGGEFTTDVPELLRLFQRRQLTENARRKIRQSLRSVGVRTDPDLMVAARRDPIRLFLAGRSRSN
jgi:hypothetical protein